MTEDRAKQTMSGDGIDLWTHELKHCDGLFTQSIGEGNGAIQGGADRVRFIGPGEINAPPIGVEGVIVALEKPDSHWECVVDFPGAPFRGNSTLPPTQYFMDFYMLVPLTPPDEKAEAFLARINKICREPINEIQKVTVGK